MGKADRVKTNKLEEELVMVKKENARLVCEKDILQKEFEKVRNEMGEEKSKLLNEISVQIEEIEELDDRLKFVQEVHNWQVKETCKLREKNKELEEKLKLFDDAEKKNKFLEEDLKKCEEENSMLKKELSTLKEEKECLNVKPFVCDETNDLSDYTINKCEFSEAKSVCDEKYKKVNDEKLADFVCYDNNSVSLKRMKKMGYEGR